jgi:hypothetical protein
MTKPSELALRNAESNLPRVDLHARIGQAEFGDVVIQLYRSQNITYNEADRILTELQVRRAYEHIAGDRASLSVPRGRARAVVLGATIVEWYLAQGLPVPPNVTANQAQRLEDAFMGKPETTEGATKAKKEPRVTNRSIIEAGLLGGKLTDEQILAEVKKVFPNGKADLKHVAYYRHFLVKEGKMAKPEKPAKAPKAPKAAKTEEAPAAAAAPAKKGGKK